MRALFFLAVLALMCAATQAGRPRCHGKKCHRPPKKTHKPKPCWWCTKKPTTKPTTTTTTTKKPSCPWGVKCCKYDSDCKGDVGPCAKLVCAKKSDKDWYKVCKVVPDTVKPSIAKCEKCPPPIVCCTDHNPCPDKGTCNVDTKYQCPPPKPTTTTPKPTTTTTTTKPPPKCYKEYPFDSYDKCFASCPKDKPDECRKCDVVEDPHHKGCYACVCKAVYPCCSPKNPKLGCPEGGKCYSYECKKYKDGPYSTCVKSLSYVSTAARCSGPKCPSTDCCRPSDKGPAYCDKGYKCNDDYECTKKWKLA